MDEKNIQELMEEARATITPKEAYDLAVAHLDVHKMIRESKKNPLTVYDIGLNFAYAGFMEGIEYALRNIEPVEEEGGAQHG